jgi:hypothetical protein
VYGYIIKLFRQQAEVIQHHENEHVRVMGQCEDRHRKYKSINLAAVKITTVQVTMLPLYHKILKIFMICSVKPVLTRDFCVVQKEEFSITCYMCEMCI